VLPVLRLQLQSVGVAAAEKLSPLGSDTVTAGSEDAWPPEEVTDGCKV
jgi:hypothetical protein